jgi:hypothetical protein
MSAGKLAGLGVWRASKKRQRAVFLSQLNGLKIRSGRSDLVCSFGRLRREDSAGFVLVKFGMPKQTQSARSGTIAVIESLHC